MTKRSQLRLRREDWLEIGLKALSEDGPRGVTIEALCHRANRTKGSFYAHFTSMDDFHASLAEDWFRRRTEAVISAIIPDDDPATALLHLDELTRDLDPRLETGMRKLATMSPIIASIVGKADELRLATLARLHMANDETTPEEAEALALFEYAAFVGLGQLDRRALNLDDARLERTYRLILPRLLRRRPITP